MPKTEKAGLEVQIPHEMLQQLIAESVGKGIAAGVGSWEVQNQIRDAGEAALLEADLPALVAAELTRLFGERAGEIATATATAMVHALEAGALDIAAVISGRMRAGLTEPKSYETSDDRKDRERKAIAEARKAIAAAMGESSPSEES